MIVATAGHVDHGKTLLVKALTGTDTDRLPEEKQRGLTIDLGFAYKASRHGEPLGFVDVPGHERFVKNMLAGVAGVDLALLVVAADDGPMPQTREHVAILDLLGIGSGVIALSKIDRVDAAQRQRAEQALRGVLAGTFLAAAPLFALSAMTGDGIDALAEHLEAEAGRIGRRLAPGGFRLAIDRVFSLTGAGVIVTGTAFAGALAPGQRLRLSPSGLEARVRGLHAQNEASAEGRAGQRLAVNIAGPDIAVEAIRRGDWLLDAGLHRPTERLDVEVRVIRDEARPLAHWTPVHVHLGAEDVTARLALLDKDEIPPGEAGLARLLLDRPIGALAPDRFILRDQTAQRTIAGGHIVDPFPPRRGRAKPDRLAWLGAARNRDPMAALAALLPLAANGIDLGGFAQARNLPADAPWPDGARRVRAGDLDALIAEAHWQALREACVAALEAWHKAQPETLGLGAAVLRQRLASRPSEALCQAALLALLRDGAVARQGQIWHRPGHSPRMPADMQRVWDRAAPLLVAGELRPPRHRELAEELNLDLALLERTIVRAARLGLVYRVAANRAFPPDAVRELARIAEDLAARGDDGLFDAKAFRDATGIGRNLTIEVLEFLDRAGLTERTGDARRIRTPADEVFP